MSTVAVTVERQPRPGRRSVRLVRSPEARSAVRDLVERRVAWTLRIADLEREYEAAIMAIEGLEAEIKGVRHAS